MQVVYPVLFAAVIAFLLVLALVAFIVVPIWAAAWALMRLLYWFVTTIVIAVNPDNWSRLHRCPPQLNFIACLAIGAATWLLALAPLAQWIGTTYLAFMLGVLWPLVGGIAPWADEHLAWISCGTASTPDADPCKEAMLDWISAPSGELTIYLAAAALWWLAVFAVYLRAGNEARRVCLIERAP
jgi:hypothetical protein